MAHFRLHSHALHVETRSWDHHDGTCDKCGLQAIQAKNTLFSCVLACKCVRCQRGSVRLHFADFYDLPLAHKITVNQTGPSYFSWAWSKYLFNFQKQTNDSYRFISELMDVFCMAGVHHQPEQSKFLAECQIKTCKLEWACNLRAVLWAFCVSRPSYLRWFKVCEEKSTRFFSSFLPILSYRGLFYYTCLA